MTKRILFLLFLILAFSTGIRTDAAQTLISGVPNYDQDLFPIDSDYGLRSGVERGDCVPIACAMLNGYYDSNGWPRLIPFGGNSIGNGFAPYSGNAWGIDTVVRKYKLEFGYTDNWLYTGTLFIPIWDSIIQNKLGNVIVSVVSYFDSGASFVRQDDNSTGYAVDWTRMQGFLNANHPCILRVTPLYLYHFYADSYKEDGSDVLKELGGGHCMCAIGWSDVSGRWIICNMGWSLSKNGWLNNDSDDDWYISQITPGGTASGEDDDPYEDNDTINQATNINAGTIYNLRCLDTKIINNDQKQSYGDWYKVTVADGQSLTSTISFINASGDLDMCLYGPGQTFIASSEGSGNSETKNVASTSSGYYYIFVYGHNNAQNQNYSLTVNVANPASAINLSCSASPSTGTPNFPCTVSGTATYNNGGGVVSSGTATITIGSQTWTAPINNGSYSRQVTAPSTSGNFQVSVSANDGIGRTGSGSASISVTGGGTASGYTIYSFDTCQSSDSAFPYTAHGIMDAFGSDDAQVTARLELDFITGSHPVEFRLFRPDGTYHSSSYGTAGNVGQSYMSFTASAPWSIPGSELQFVPGVWNIKLYIDGNYMQSVAFTMRYNLTEHRMAKDVQSASPYDLIQPSNIFYQTDQKALVWLNLANVSNPLDIKWTFHEPNGAQYVEGFYTTSDPNLYGYNFWGYFKCWYWIGISGNSAANKCGDWYVDVSIKNSSGNWVKQYTDYFKILESPSVPPSCAVSLSTANPVPGQNLSLSISATDNTYLKNVAVYWKDASLHSSQWNNPMTGSFNQSLNIGTFPDGVIEYWVVATDTSGNTTESTHNTVTLTSTRIISLSGNLAFGGVATNATPTQILKITNSGNSTLNVNSISLPPGFRCNWTNGLIGAGSFTNVTVTFAPTTVSSYGGTLTVNSDATSGTNAVTVSGNGTATIPVTVVANGPGHFFVDNVEVGSQTFNWTPGTSHTISAAPSQSGSSHSINDWVNWSDGGLMSHTVTPIVATTYTATFVTKFTVGIIAGAGGTVSVAPTNPPGVYSDWYNAGTILTITATPSSGFFFNGWTSSFPAQTGAYNGMNNPATVTVNGWFSETAKFIAFPKVQTSPPGLVFTVDGQSYSSSQSFTWNLYSSHTIAVASPQTNATGAKYVWAGWSDGQSMSHSSFYDGTVSNYTASFKIANQVAAQMLGAGNIRLSFVGDPTAKYALERTVTLTPASWVTLTTNIAAWDGSLAFTNIVNSSTNNFWRIRSVP